MDDRLVIIWSIVSALGGGLLLLILWGIKKLINMTLANSTQIEVLHTKMNIVFRDIDGVAAVVGTQRSKGKKLNEGDEDED